MKNNIANNEKNDEKLYFGNDEMREKIYAVCSRKFACEDELREKYDALVNEFDKCREFLSGVSLDSEEQFTRKDALAISIALGYSDFLTVLFEHYEAEKVKTES